MTIERLFTGQTPAILDLDEAVAVMLATGHMFNVPGNVIGVEFYTPTTLSASYTVQLWRVDDQDDTPAGTLLGSGSISSGLVSNTWTDVMFGTPVAVEPGIAYRSSYHSSNGRLTATTDFFASSGLENGNIEAWVSGADPVLLGTLRNGSYRDTPTVAYPFDSFNETCYFVGPIFDNDPEDFDARRHSMLLTF
jgi:hypothetical protein